VSPSFVGCRCLDVLADVRMSKQVGLVTRLRQQRLERKTADTNA
jgi:hypothetical protein